MVRILRSMMLPAAAGVAILCFCVAAQAQARGGLSAAPGQFRQTYYSLPGYWSLQSQAVRDELNLTEKQLAKLAEISKKRGEQMRQGYNREEWAKIAKLPREERTKKYAELAQERRKRSAEFTKQIEDVLTRRQLDELKMIELRRRGVYYLTNPRMAEAIGLSEEQQEKLRKNRQELTEATQKLQRESAQKALDILTPQQLEQLKKMHAEGYQSLRTQPYQRPKPQ